MGGKATGSSKISRATANLVIDSVANILDPVATWMVAGSFRRGRDPVGDIDFVVIPKPGSDFADHMKREFGAKLKVDSGSKASVKVGTEEGPCQVDFYVASPKDEAAQVLTWTGPKSWNIWCRKRAKDLGYRLSQYGVFVIADDEIKTFETEAEILEFIGVQYIVPAQRDDSRKWKLSSETTRGDVI